MAALHAAREGLYVRARELAEAVLRATIPVPRSVITLWAWLWMKEKETLLWLCVITPKHGP